MKYAKANPLSNPTTNSCFSSHNVFHLYWRIIKAKKTASTKRNQKNFSYKTLKISLSWTAWNEAQDDLHFLQSHWADCTRFSSGLSMPSQLKDAKEIMGQALPYEGKLLFFNNTHAENLSHLNVKDPTHQRSPPESLKNDTMWLWGHSKGTAGNLCWQPA